MMRMFIEDFELDIDKELVNRITYALDDLENLDSKATPFSKTIILPGTKNNNGLLGNIFEFNNSNFTFDVDPNVNYNFNAARTAKCRIELNGLQIIKGVFRLLEIVYDGSQIEYECSVFGELGGFMSKVGNLRLEDLDFSIYNQDWTNANIVASWDNANTGENVYYPLMDIGLVSTGTPYGTEKKDYQYRAFRPALHVREYINKIITNAGYTWESDFFNTDFFKRLIIPHNSKALTRISATAFSAVAATGLSAPISNPLFYPFPTQPVLGSFVASAGNTTFTYINSTALTANLNLLFAGTYTKPSTSGVITCTVWRNYGTGTAAILGHTQFGLGTTSGTIAINIYSPGSIFNNTDTLTVTFNGQLTSGGYTITITSGSLIISTAQAAPVQLNLGEAIIMNDTIPRGVYQKDFFTSILKMFYLMVDEDKFKEKHLVIKPWVDFFNLDPLTYEDWSAKVDRSKQIRIKPMSELNSRYYELSYKQDNDFYNEGYKKKYNEGYGNRFFDNGFEFSKDTDKVEIIFANTVLLGYSGEDKIVPTVFKKTNDIEERIDHVIRIMQATKVTGVSSWDIMNGTTVLSSHTDYPYAGHLDDPDVPDADICFGVPKELFFGLVSGDLSNNLFNVYYSPYMAEITDKDSRLLQCMLKLTDSDIFNLDFAKFKFIDGGLYRLNKISDYAAGENETTKCELLRVIYTTY